MRRAAIYIYLLHGFVIRYPAVRGLFVYDDAHNLALAVGISLVCVIVFGSVGALVRWVQKRVRQSVRKSREQADDTGLKRRGSHSR